MNLVSMFGYSLFPLSGDKTEMAFGNIMHIMVNVIVVFAIIVAGFVYSNRLLKTGENKTSWNVYPYHVGYYNNNRCSQPDWDREQLEHLRAYRKSCHLFLTTNDVCFLSLLHILKDRKHYAYLIKNLMDL